MHQSGNVMSLCLVRKKGQHLGPPFFRKTLLVYQNQTVGCETLRSVLLFEVRICHQRRQWGQRQWRNVRRIGQTLNFGLAVSKQANMSLANSSPPPSSWTSSHVHKHVQWSEKRDEGKHWRHQGRKGRKTNVGSQCSTNPQNTVGLVGHITTSTRNEPK